MENNQNSVNLDSMEIQFSRHSKANEALFLQSRGVIEQLVARVRELEAKLEPKQEDAKADKAKKA